MLYFSHLAINFPIFLVQIFLNQEHRLMLAFAPDYDHLPLIAKVEVFQHALQNTEGNDLAKVLCCLLSVCVTK
jgi:hypothetical protein